MGTVYSKLFADDGFDTTGNLNVGPPPSGTVWVVVDIWVNVDVGTGSPFFAPPGQTHWTITDQLDRPLLTSNSGWIPAGGYSTHWHGRQVLEPGQELIFKSTVNDCYARVSGYELTLP